MPTKISGIPRVETQLKGLVEVQDPSLGADEFGKLDLALIATGLSLRDPRAWTTGGRGGSPNRYGAVPVQPHTNPAGIPQLTLAGYVYVPSGTSTQGVAGYVPGIGMPSAQANSLGLEWVTGSNLVIRANGATTADFRRLTCAGLRSTYADQWIFLSVGFERGTADPVVHVNGVLHAGTADDDGTAPDWLDPNLDAIEYQWGHRSFTRPVECLIPINALLTADDRIEWMLRGSPPAWVELGGSVTGDYVSDFSGGVDSWITINAGGTNGVIAGNIDGIGGEDDCLRYTDAAGAGFRIVYRSGLNSANQRIRCDGRIYVPSSNTTLAGVLPSFFNGGGTGNLIPSPDTWELFRFYSGSLNSADGTMNANMSVSPCNSSGTQSYTGTAGDLLYYKDVIFIPLGALFLPEPTCAFTVNDNSRRSPASGQLYGASGINRLMPIRGARLIEIHIPARAWTGAVSVRVAELDVMRAYRIMSVAGITTDAANLSIGPLSGSTSYVDTQAVTGEFDLSTFATRRIGSVPTNTTRSLWATFSADTTASLHIVLIPA